LRVGEVLTQRRGLRGAAHGVAVAALLYLVPIMLGIALASAYEPGNQDDFDANVWQPFHAVLNGLSPYPPADLAALVGRRTFVYPPVMLWIGAPFTVLPHDVARVLFGVVCALVVAGALRLLGVRDHRCYVCVLLSVPVVQGLAVGNPTLLLALPLAVAWRYRDRPWVTAIAVACLVGVKPVLWPLGLWLLATRRFGTAILAVLVTLYTVFGTWAAIEFRGMTAYPELVRLIGEKTAGPRGSSITTFAEGIGLGHSPGRVLQLACGVALLACVVAVARRADGDRRAFSLAVVAALVLSPVFWLHYLVLVLVLLAIAHPHYGWQWLPAQAFWVVVFLPAGPTYVVSDGEHVVGTFGVVPSPVRVAAALAFLAAMGWITGRSRPARDVAPSAKRLFEPLAPVPDAARL
jgi:hypothetical protein